MKYDETFKGSTQKYRQKRRKRVYTLHEKKKTSVLREVA